MRIAHYVDSTNLRDGGVPRFVMDISRVMTQAGHQSTMMTTDTTDTPSEWLENDYAGLPWVRVLDRAKFPGAMLSSAGMRAARQTLRNVDVLHLHCVWSIPNLQLAAAARAMGVPYVISSHGMLDDWSMAQSARKKTAYMALGARAMLERAAFVHTTAQAELEQSRKWFARGTGTVVPYIVDLAPYKTLPGAGLARETFAFLRDEQTPTLLFLSRVHPKKGVEHLIRASKLLHDRGVRHNLAIAGPGETSYVESLKSLAAEQGVAKSTHFVGMVRGELRTSLYEACNLFVLPTSQENFGIVLLESLCCRTPVVTTKGVDIWQELASSGAASIVEGDNLPAQIAISVTQQLADLPALARTSEVGRVWGMSTFDDSATVPRFERMYARSLSRVAAPVASRFAALAAR
jgi:glycosyltransferase involved in cell wall biosynthesis